MDRGVAWELLSTSVVAVLATIDEDGSPHMVPFTFATLGPHRLVSVVDEKPKTTRRLHRLDNIRRDSRVTVLAHHFDDDWSALWWVRARGRATVADKQPPGARALLVERYPMYAGQELGPWLVIEVEDLTGWSATG